MRPACLGKGKMAGLNPNSEVEFLRKRSAAVPAGMTFKMRDAWVRNSRLINMNNCPEWGCREKRGCTRYFPLLDTRKKHCLISLNH